MSDLPAGWEWTTVAEIAEVRLGRQRSPKNHSGPNMRPYLRAANVTWDGLDLTDVKEMNFTPEEVEVYRLQRGDVLLAEASGSPGEVGKPALWNEEIEGCCFQNTLLRVRSIGPDRRFLLYLFHHEAAQGRFGRAAPGVGIHHLGATRLSKWPVPLPPLAEQQRVVAALDEQLPRLEAGITCVINARRKNALLRDASLTAVLDSQAWPVKTLAEITEPDRPIIYGILMPKRHIPDGIPYVRVKDFPAGKVDVAELKRTSPEIAAKYKRSTLRPNDVLLAIRGTYGRVAIVPTELDGGNITQDTARISPRDGILPQYVAAFLRSSGAQRYLRRVSRGVAVKGVNIGDLRRMPIPVPPIDVQRRLVEDVDERDTTCTALDAAITLAETRARSLRKVILERALTGRLVPQDPSDEPASVLLERIGAEREAQGTPARRGRRRTSADVL